METVVNKYRVCVKKWCGSCEHREVDEESWGTVRHKDTKEIVIR